jgi:hypothetical protein
MSNLTFMEFIVPTREFTFSSIIHGRDRIPPDTSWWLFCFSLDIEIIFHRYDISYIKDVIKDVTIPLYYLSDADFDPIFAPTHCHMANSHPTLLPKISMTVCSVIFNRVFPPSD